MHSCAPPKDADPRAQTLWVCAGCGSVWEAAPEQGGIFDFERDDVVARAEWILLEEGSWTSLAG
ncbi:MAG TPA: hypothetical protein VE646_11675 [Actinomycetota bacterium]|nr:hypothetical protein [Actinomycetota bacterium]